MRWAVAGVGLLLMVVGVGLGLGRVVELELAEVQHLGDWVPLEPTASDVGPAEPHRELARVHLEQGQDAVFEICSRDRLDPGTWDGVLDIVVWHPEDQQLLVRTSLDRHRLDGAQRSSSGACVVVARGRDLPQGGELALEAVWPDRELPPGVAAVPLRVRVAAHDRLASDDRWPVLAVLLGALLAVLGLSRRSVAPPATRPELPGSRGRAASYLVVGVVLLLLVGAVAGLAPIHGSAAALGRGLLIALSEVVLAVVLVRASLRETAGSLPLGLTLPSRGNWMLIAAPFVGILLWLVGGLALRFVPATAEAPIEAVVSWPSGTLAVALVAVLVPVAEEIFFRGFVFGTARRFGEPLAFAVTVVLFAAAHLAQDWGAWGAFTAVFITGVGLTALRWWTGSTLVCVLAHLAHNTAIVLVSFSGLE